MIHEPVASHEVPRVQGKHSAVAPKCYAKNDVAMSEVRVAAAAFDCSDMCRSVVACVRIQSRCSNMVAISNSTTVIGTTISINSAFSLENNECVTQLRRRSCRRGRNWTLVE
jgi:hypothetical protein